MQPICLPAPGQEFGGKEALALGWGRFNAKRDQGHGQARELRYVHLTVSTRQYRLVLCSAPTVPQPVFTITEKAPTRAFSWLKAPISAFTFKILLRHCAKRALTPR